MDYNCPSLPFEVPDLPIGCNSIQATTEPGHDTQLENHLGQLPGLDQDRLNCLAARAHRSQGDSHDTLETVLGLSDLLRQQANRRISLHPRVTHVVPLDKLDPLLEEVANLLDADSSQNAYQYPAHLLECRGTTPDKQALYPPEYHIRTADLVNNLRSDGILTSVRRPDQPALDTKEVQATVEAMDTDGTRVYGSISLFQPHDAPEPKLYIHEYSNCANPPTKEEMVDHCLYLFHRHGTILDIPNYEN